MKGQLAAWRKRHSKELLREKAEKEKVSTTQRNIVKDGSIFFTYCPDNRDWYRTIRLHKNPWTQVLNPQISNALPSPPPPEIKEISPILLQKVMTMPLSTSF